MAMAISNIHYHANFGINILTQVSRVIFGLNIPTEVLRDIFNPDILSNVLF